MGRNGHLSLIAATVCSIPALTHAAGFALIEQSGSGIGSAFAGSAASADDASAMFFNPAALSLLGAPQVAAAAHGINLEAKFTDRGSTLPPGGLGLLPAGATRNDAGDFIPTGNVYFAMPFNEKLAFGFGVNAPFGLVTEYDDPWVGRFQGIRTELKTVNANPAVSYRVNDQVALGAGVNYQYASAELSNAVMLAQGVEGRALLDVNDEALGWNAGALFTLPSSARVGLSYRSRLDYSLAGDTTVNTLTGITIPTVSGPTSVDVTFPDSVYISLAQPFGAATEIRADVSWTNWSRVGTLFAVNSQTGVPRDVLQFDFDDAWRVALGAQYRQNDRWTLRGGLAWDQSPVKDDVRTVRLPDSDRYWVSLGARWQPADQLSVDLGYAHLFLEDASLDRTRPQLGVVPPGVFASTVHGDYTSSVDIISAQLTWAFR
jgi:long-chain fatty acid transport protein